jgi:hypothetical protein
MKATPAPDLLIVHPRSPLMQAARYAWREVKRRKPFSRIATSV